MSAKSRSNSIFSQISGTFLLRYSIWFLCIFYCIIYVINLPILNVFFSITVQNILFVTALLLSLLGLYDVLQTKHAILYNYPIIGHFRYFFEAIREAIRQYFIESDTDEVPFSKIQRDLVYKRAKNLNADHPFGTLVNVYRTDHDFLMHSIAPAPKMNIEELKITIGNEACKQPYTASILNISAMSFGSLSANAIRALNKGAKMGGFYHDTGEGSISPYHLEYGGDLVWEIGSGYFGCRDESGNFDANKFAQQAVLPNVKMIEIKISQGAKPAHGGILPKEKISEEIAQVRGISREQDCISPPYHTKFSTPYELIDFIQELRELSQGKPVGFKLCIGNPIEFMNVVKAMLKRNVYPDFIVVDGAEGGTGATPIEFADNLGTPLRDGLLFVHNVLVGTGIRSKIKIGASGKIISAFDIAKVLAFGADWANSARGFMFSIGCIQSLSCHNNKCPTGVATQDPKRQKALNVDEKSNRVFHFHKNTLNGFAEMIAAAGLTSASEINPRQIAVRKTSNQIITLFHENTFLQEDELLQKQDKKIADNKIYYHQLWQRATADSFR
ncbi:FMN-binding glutamate synthase family protein [Neisseriaceae bacterium PsAf]|nr:FMN-binding glutamate synthase family protein [Neisseriaceae bacterium PsAf]MCV2503277.1 FMN-binding glutamate synthase family protein [Neisseriaceae bacterium]